jgi:hypothetical protein
LKGIKSRVGGLEGIKGRVGGVEVWRFGGWLKAIRV